MVMVSLEILLYRISNDSCYFSLFEIPYLFVLRTLAFCEIGVLGRRRFDMNLLSALMRHFEP